MEHSPETAYTLIRVALQQFNKPLSELDDAEQQAVLQQANRELAIAKKLLATEKAAHVVIPDSAIEQSLKELKQQFESDEAFLLAMSQNGLDEGQLRQALRHELKVETIIEQVVNENAGVSNEEIEIYYYQHLEKFQLPETRTARHILITINEDYPENTSAEAQRRLEEIRDKYLRGEESFQSLAEKHSECPTAMHGGLLGRVKPGQLYPELEQVLFGMEEGALSDIIHTPVGLHLIYCEQIHEPECLSFAAVRDKLEAHLEKKKRARLLRDWLKQAA